MTGAGTKRRQRGQSTVEAVALAPIVLLVGLVCLQALVVGAGAVQVDNAAHAAAVAWAESGADAARRAASSALPGWSRSDVATRISGGRVYVSVRPRAVVPVRPPALRSSAPLASAGSQGPVR
jgi:Flp pilus assembly protein TadG